MSSVAKDDFSNLTNDQLRLRLLQNGLGNVPVTDSTRGVLLKRLRKALEGQKSDSRRETIHVIKHSIEVNDSKPAPASKKTNRRNTMNAVPITTEEVVPVPKIKNMRRSGRTTPFIIENGNSAPISARPSQSDIIESDEDLVRETYVPPKRTSRSPSLGKSQTVVTSYKTEVAKPIPIIESTEEDEDDYSNEEENERNLYPSLPTNGFNNFSPTKKLSSTLRRTTTHTTNYEPTSYKSYEQNYKDVSTFKAPLTKPTIGRMDPPSTSGLSRRYTTNNFTSKHLPQNYEDDSGTEQSDIEAPYLSNFAKRLSQLRPEPLDRKIIADVKYQTGLADDSLWRSFSNLVTAFGRKFGSILLASVVLMIVVFVYVFFIMG